MFKSRKISTLVMVLFLLTLFTASSVATAAAAQTPPDVNGHWAQSQIETMLAKGIASGYPNGTFGPENPITRAEFISMINKVFNYTTPAAINFVDVKADDWYYNDIAIAKAAGYIAGDPDGKMRPNDVITRQEVAVIIAQILKLDTTDASVLAKFSDWASIPEWSRGSLAAMVNAGYMSGNPNGTLQAFSPTTRAMAAVILAQVLEDLTKPVPNPNTGSTSSNSTGGSSNHDNSAPYIVDITAPNLIFTPSAYSNNYTVSMLNSDPIGEVTVVFNEAIQKDSVDDFRIRAYSGFNATGELTWSAGAEEFAKDRLYEKFASGDSRELDGYINSDYDLLYNAMSLSFVGMPEVNCIQVDIYDLAHNKATITLNITKNITPP